MQLRPSLSLPVSLGLCAALGCSGAESSDGSGLAMPSSSTAPTLGTPSASSPVGPSTGSSTSPNGPALTSTVPGISTPGVGGGPGVVPPDGSGGTAPTPTEPGEPVVDNPETQCTETAAIPQRLIRLNFQQLANTYAALLGPEAIEGVVLDNPRQREFQPLFSVEGLTITTQVLQKSLDIARSAAQSITGRFEAVTGCAAPVSDECAVGFLGGLATRAFRRPLSAEETAGVEQLYNDVKAAGHDAETSTVYATQGILLAPATLYRTEFGALGADGNAVLDAYELASAVSYFLMDGPPDDALLAAAASGALSTQPGLEAEVDRLLALPEVQENLTKVVMAYLRLGDLDSVIKSETVFPEDVFNIGLRNAMYTETELFLQNTLWQGTLPDLLTSRTSYVNEPLAAHYGVPYPGSANPAEDFLPVTLPEERSGILTQASILSMRALPDTTSVVGRGLFVNSAFLCVKRVPAPTDATTLEAIEEQVNDSTATEREKAEFRSSTSPCLSCHTTFDPYGLALENYDAIGRYRTTYSNGDTIDASAATPAPLTRAAMAAGATSVPETLNDFSDLVALMDDSGLFSHCLTANMLKYAAAAPVVNADECVVGDVDAQVASDLTFTNLVRQVALSTVVSTRSVEAAP